MATATNIEMQYILYFRKILNIEIEYGFHSIFYFLHKQNNIAYPIEYNIQEYTYPIESTKHGLKKCTC